MLQKYKTKREEGFTIIEVLIVLAIAGLIILIVFLAVPALQRNARNNARNSDASRISAAVSECLSNRNGLADQCSAGNTGNISTGTLSQLTDALVAYTTAPGTAVTGTRSGANVVFGVKCAEDGSNAYSATGASARDFAVVYLVETSSSGTTPRCI